MKKLLAGLLPLAALGCVPEAQRIQVDFVEALATVDANGDGLQDLVWIDFSIEFSARRLLASLQNEAGVFGAPLELVDNNGAPLLADQLGFTDFDADGDTDILLSRFETPPLLAENQGAGGFVQRGLVGVEELTSLSAIASADLNNDGRQDLLTLGFDANFLGEAVVALQQADGSFVITDRQPTGSGQGSLTPSDLDNDGDTDFFMLDFFGVGTLTLRNDGQGGMTSEILPDTFVTVGASAFLVDLNGDTAPEVFVFGSETSPSSFLLRNDGAGNFAREVLAPEGRELLGGAVGDVGGDGAPDIVSQGYSNNPFGGGLRPLAHIDIFSMEGGEIASRPREVRIADELINNLRVVDLNGDGVAEILYVALLTNEIVIMTP